MTPIDFYTRHVDRNVIAALSSVTDEHLCKEACVSLNSFVDYWWHENNVTNPGALWRAPKAGDLRNLIAKQVAAFALLRDVAESHKHRTLSRPNKKVTTTDQTSSRSATWQDLRDVTWEMPTGLLHSWETADRMVIVDADDGSTLPVIELIVSVDAYFRKILGLAPRSLEPFAPKG